MAEISGKQALIGVNVATTWGTEVACTHLVPVDSWNFGKSVAELSTLPIGLNKSMADEAESGAETINPSFAAKLNYEETYGFFFAQFMGTAGTPTEQNGGEGDYLHRLTFNETINSNYLTCSVKESSATTSTFPSCAVSGVTVNFNNPPNYVDASFNMVADQIDLSSSTNTTAVLEALAATSANMVVLEQADSFLINAQAGGALTSPTDKVNITACTVTMSRPQGSIPEIKGAAGNSDPVDQGLFEVSMTVTLKSMEDHTYLTAADAGTEYKASISVEGAQIGSGDNERFAIFIPRMTIVDFPGYDLTSTGFNPLNITFKALVAASNPTGMNSTYPYIEYTNNYATDLLA